jgi:hypothetical protein
MDRNFREGDRVVIVSDACVSPRRGTFCGHTARAESGELFYCVELDGGSHTRFSEGVIVRLNTLDRIAESI